MLIPSDAVLIRGVRPERDHPPSHRDGDRSDAVLIPSVDLENGRVVQFVEGERPAIETGTDPTPC